MEQVEDREELEGSGTTLGGTEEEEKDEERGESSTSWMVPEEVRGVAGESKTAGCCSG